MVAEAAIIRMLLNGHDLDTVVPIFHHTWKNLLLKLTVRAHLLLILSHTDVALVDQQRVCARLESAFLELIRLFRCPYLSAEDLGIVILYHTGSPCGDALSIATIPVDMQFIEVAMLQRLLWQFQFPVAVLQRLHLIFGILFPVVERTNQIDLRCIRCPFTQHPSFVGTVQSEVQMTSSKVAQ